MSGAFPEVTLESVGTLRKAYPNPEVILQSRKEAGGAGAPGQVGRLRRPAGARRGWGGAPGPLLFAFVSLFHCARFCPTSGGFLSVFCSLYVSASLCLFLLFSGPSPSASPPSPPGPPLHFPLALSPSLSARRNGVGSSEAGAARAWCPLLPGPPRICGCAFFIWGCSCPLSSGFRTRDWD